MLMRTNRLVSLLLAMILGLACTLVMPPLTASACPLASSGSQSDPTAVAIGGTITGTFVTSGDRAADCPTTLSHEDDAPNWVPPAWMTNETYGFYGVGWIYLKDHLGLIEPGCIDGNLWICVPRDPALPPDAPGPAAPSFAQAENMARSLQVVLNLDSPDIHIGPEPAANEWNMAVVGYPLWLWTTEATSRTATVTRYGYTFTLSARRTGVVFNMGDGTPSFTCATTTPYPGETAIGVSSPDCGHRYATPSLPTGTFSVRATAVWVVDWSMGTFSGSLPLRLSQARSVRVGELQSIQVRAGG